MKLLITGSNGQLGKALCSLLKNEHELVLTDQNELDITDLSSVVNCILGANINYVINAAAFTAVDKCEDEYLSAYNVNAIGARNLSIATNKIDIPIIHISTDYVFDGDGLLDHDGKKRPYYEFDSPNPQSIYGKTKYAAEQLVIAHNPKHFILRTAWLYGDGANFVNTMLNLAANHNQLKVVDDQIGTPTSSLELARGIQVLLGTEEYGIYHATCEGQCSWYDFAKKIFDLNNIKIDVCPCSTDEFPRPAKRPHYSVLENAMFKLRHNYNFSDWQTALEDFFKEKN